MVKKFLYTVSEVMQILDQRTINNHYFTKKTITRMGKLQYIITDKVTTKLSFTSHIEQEVDTHGWPISPSH